MYPWLERGARDTIRQLIRSFDPEGGGAQMGFYAQNFISSLFSTFCLFFDISIFCIMK